MSDVVRYTEGAREYAVFGLEAKAEAIRGQARRLDGLLASLHGGMVTVQEDLRGPVATSVAEYHNAAVRAAGALYSSLSLTAMRVGAFPAHIPPSGYIGQSINMHVDEARVPVPDDDGSAGADIEALRAYADTARGGSTSFPSIAAVVDLDGLRAEVTYPRSLTATERQPYLEAGFPPSDVDLMTVETTEPVPVRELISLRPPTDAADTAKGEYQRAAELAIATAGAFEAADSTLLDLLATNPELSAYLVPGLTPDVMAGETVLAVILAHFDDLDVGAGRGGLDDNVSLNDLLSVIEDPDADPLLRAAAEYLLANPTFLSLVDTGMNGAGTTAAFDSSGVALTSGDIRLFLEANAHLDVLHGADLSDVDHDGDGFIDHESLWLAQTHPDSVGLSPEEAAAFAFFAEHPHLAGSFTSSGGGGWDLDHMTARLINGQAHAHDPEAARAFILSLEVVEDGETGFPITLVNDDGFTALATAGLIAADGDLSESQEVIAHLPETSSGLRNELITGFYDMVAQRADGVFAGAWDVPAGDPTGPGHGGANWLIFAPWASEGVHDVITGDLTVFTIAPPRGARQAAADGNQWIFDDITSRYVAFVELYESTGGDPSSEQLQRFFDTEFGPGDEQIRDGFRAYVAAMGEVDPAVRQQLMFQANTSVAIHEQAGAQPYLERVSVGPDGIVVAYVDVEMGDGHVVHVDQDLDDVAGPSNLIDDAPILSMDPTRPGGVPDVPGVTFDPIGGWEDGFEVSTTAWAEANGAADDPDDLDGTGASSWPDYEERMWSIHRLFEQLHTDPSLYDTSTLGRDLDDVSYLVGVVDW